MEMKPEKTENVLEEEEEEGIREGQGEQLGAF